MSNQHSSSATEHFNKLIQFRQAAYEELGPARDALFELTDAVIQLQHIQSFVELSCAPAFRRKWSSAYEALQDGRPNRAGLLQVYLKQCDPQARLVLVGDHSAWPRLWAEKLAGRSYQHQPTPIPGRRPVTIGLGFSSLAVIPEVRSSWALPVLIEPIEQQKPIPTASHQLRQVCALLPVRPLSLWDSEYGCASFVKATADVAADELIRLRSNLCLEGPTKPPHTGRGRQPTHGIPFNFKDPSTWWTPDQVVEYQDPELGPIVARVWRGLRFSQARDCLMIVAQIERPQAPGTRRKPKILWFAWRGQEPPERWWSQYGQRFPVEHWYRFAKGRLYWTLPRLSTGAQCQRWSDLMPFITWELWLARSLAEDCPRPWQKPLAKLPPGRVCQGMLPILATIGTPAKVCKPRGKSPGWPTGHPRAHRETQELIRSQQWKQKRARQKATQEAEALQKAPPQPVPAAQVA